MGVKWVTMTLLGENFELGVVGSLAVEVEVVVPIDAPGFATGEAADIEAVEVACLRVKLYLGPSSFDEASRRRLVEVPLRHEVLALHVQGSYSGRRLHFEECTNE